MFLPLKCEDDTEEECFFLSLRALDSEGDETRVATIYKWSPGLAGQGVEFRSSICARADPSYSVMFDIKGRGHFARRWLPEVARGTRFAPRSYWCLRAEDIFVCGSVNSAPQTSHDDGGRGGGYRATSKRRPLFPDTLDFAIPHAPLSGDAS